MATIPKSRSLALTLTLTIGALLPLRADAQTGLAIVNHAPALSGNARIEGSIQQLTGEGASFSGNTSITGEFRVPGTPTLQLSGRARSGGLVPGVGAPSPTGYAIALSGNASIGRLVTRADPAGLPRVDRPPPPTGTRTLSTNDRNPDIGDFRTLRDLTVNGSGSVRIPPGFYGALIANGNATLILGRADSVGPSVYGFDRISINGNGRLQVDGPVVATLATGFYSGRTTGSVDHPAWLEIRVAAGDVAFSGDAAFLGSLIAPLSVVALSGNASLAGALIAGRLRLEGNASLRLLPDLPRRLPMTASVPYATGFESAEEYAPGSLAGQRGWTISGGAVNVVRTPVFEGTQAIEVPAGQSATALLPFETSLPAVTFVDAIVHARADAALQSGTQFDFSGGAVRLRSAGGVGHWEVLDGPSWRPVEGAVPLDPSGVVTGWHRLTARLAYDRRTWDLFVDSRVSLTDLAVAEPASSKLGSLALGSPGPAQFDLLFAGYENPLFPDADVDGLDDAWEIANQLDPTRDDRDADRDGDGLSNLREFLLGTRASAADTDGDGVSDGTELAQSRNPLRGATPDAGTLHLQLHRPN